MLYDYIAAFVVVLLSLAVPFLLILSSKMMQKKASPNRVKNAPYESGESPIGHTGNFESEYLSYFAIFLPIEFVAVLFLLVTALPGGTQAVGSYFIALLVVAAIVSLALYKAIGGNVVN
jgi:NADH:ubiquinone oxidoreductase subunit 3 (subunit A)